MNGIRRLAALVSLVGLVAAACGGGSSTEGATPEEQPTATGVCATVDQAAGDLLAKICADGVIRVSTDPAYPPQSYLNEETGQYEGFDIDVATEIANRLGVEVAWETPQWDVITAGSWNGRWDMSVGSMTATAERKEVLWFTAPYYYGLAVAVVPADSALADPATDLDGKKIGVCGACTYDAFLAGDLAIEGVTVDYVVDDAEINTYDTDTTALADLVAGRVDAVITAASVAQGWIDEGNAGRILSPAYFGEPMSVAFDKSSELDATSLLQAVDAILNEMRADGTLGASSVQWFGIDQSQAPA
ncbi:MAG: transporter substrate-binding domain-containing protein [Actinomycetota bacterium]